MKRVFGNMSFEVKNISSILQVQKFLKTAPDGSVKHNQGTESWAIWNDNKEITSIQLIVDGFYIDSFI